MSMINIELKPQVAVASAKADDQNVVYSKQILSALREKVKLHNAIASKKVHFYQLRDVYMTGAKEVAEGSTSNESGWARVNMYLRMLGEIASAAHAANQEAKKTSKTVLDFSCLLKPNDMDYAQAKVDLVSLSVNFDFGDVADLYLNEDNPLQYYEKFL